MSDVVYCNKEQAEKILKNYFSVPLIITEVSKCYENGMYFIKALTIPGFHRTEWQYRNWRHYNTKKVIGACYGHIYKSDRRYDLYDTYSDELMSSINKSFERAIDRYERGCDIFQSESIQYVRGFFKNIFYNLTKSPKRKYIWTIIILSILLILSLTSCYYKDSIQNYIGSEVIKISSFEDTNKMTTYSVLLRIHEKGEYYLKTIQCYDAKGYQPGDTIKLTNFQK